MAENILTLITGDTSAGQQYQDTFRRSERFEPEKILIAAILEDAVHEYRKYRRAGDPKGKKRFRDAEKWIMNRSSDWIFSFDNVCELLGLDPEYVRRGILGMNRKHSEEEKRVRRDSMRGGVE